MMISQKKKQNNLQSMRMNPVKKNTSVNKKIMKQDEKKKKKMKKSFKEKFKKKGNNF